MPTETKHPHDETCWCQHHAVGMSSSGGTIRLVGVYTKKDGDTIQGNPNRPVGGYKTLQTGLE